MQITNKDIKKKKCPTRPGVLSEPFSIGYRKTKIKVITLANHKGHR